MTKNKPVVISLAVVAVLLAIYAISTVTRGYPPPPPLASGSPVTPSAAPVTAGANVSTTPGAVLPTPGGGGGGAMLSPGSPGRP